MPLLRALRQITGYSRGDVFFCEDIRAAQLLKKVPQIVEVVIAAQAITPKQVAEKPVAQAITSEKIVRKHHK